MGEVWIISGIPGAGKTTTAAALAARLPRSAHLESDRLQACIVSGAVWPGEEPREEEDRQVRLNIRHQCMLARSFAAEGFVPVLDFVVLHRGRVEEYREQLDGLVLRLVTLAPGVEVALQRDEARPEKTVAPRWVHLDPVIRDGLAGTGLWIDNGPLTVDETVDLILARRDAAVV